MRSHLTANQVKFLIGLVFLTSACSEQDGAPKTMKGETMSSEVASPANTPKDTSNRHGDDISYLHTLLQVRGHLAALNALEAGGHAEMAASHARHPEDELYGQLAPVFEKRGLPGFAAELEAINSALTNGRDIDEVYKAARTAIGAHEPAVPAQVWLRAVAKLTGTAADEYAEGVDSDGQIRNRHEYQDAWGFLYATHERLAGVNGKSAEEIAALQNARALLTERIAQFGPLTADQNEMPADDLRRAAQSIEDMAAALTSN